MIINKDNFNKFALEKFTRLPGEIRIQNGNSQLTIDDFNKVTNSGEAKHAKNIIYIWRTVNDIPRLKGSSNIVYIGQTSKSFYSRHGSSKIKATSKANSQKYNDIVSQYGAMTVSYINLNDFAPGSDLLQAEGQFLWWYFLNHSEYPPVNYTKTKVRNDEFEINV